MKRAEAASGQFAQVPFSHLLIHALDHRLRGTFRIVPESGEEQLVAVSNGLPVRVLVPDAFALMSRVLLEFGVVQASAPELLEWDDTALGEALLAAGKIDGAQLERALAMQLGLRLVRVFSFGDATQWQFTPDDHAFSHIVSSPGRVDPLRVMWAGLSRYGERGGALTTVIERVAARRFTLRAEVPTARFGFSGGAAELAALLGAQSWSLTSLQKRRLVPEHLAQSVVYLLAITRFLDFSVRDEAVAEPELVDPEPAVIPRQDRSVGTEERAAELAPGQQHEAATIGRIELRRLAEPARAAVSGPAEVQEPTPLPGFSNVIDKYLVPEPSSGDLFSTHRNITPFECHERAHAALAMGRPEDAQRWCSQARELDPQNPDFAASAVWVELHLPHPDLKTLSLRLDDVLSRHQKHVAARFYRACVSQRMGDLKAAQQMFETVLELAPSHAAAAGKLSALRGETVI